MKARFLAGCSASVLMAAVVLTTGCKSEKPISSVSGKVTYNGVPLTSGSVNFLSTTGSAGQGLLDETGSYKIDGPLDAGEYQVYLGAPVPGQFAPGSKQAVAPPKFNVAPKFLDPASSGFKVTLKPGPNEVPIDMKL